MSYCSAQHCVHQLFHKVHLGLPRLPPLTPAMSQLCWPFRALPLILRSCSSVGRGGPALQSLWSRCSFVLTLLSWDAVEVLQFVVWCWIPLPVIMLLGNSFFPSLILVYYCFFQFAFLGYLHLGEWLYESECSTGQNMYFLMSILVSFTLFFILIRSFVENCFMNKFNNLKL